MMQETILSQQKRNILTSAQFLSAFKSFTENSNQKPLIVKFLSGRLPKLLEPRGSKLRILDIGCGTGEISIPLYNSLASHYPDIEVKVDILEPSHEVNKSFLQRYNSNKNNLFKIGNALTGYWEHCSVHGKYDFILASHILYRIFENPQLTTAQKSAAVQKILTSLRDNGLACIIYHSAEGNDAYALRHKVSKLSGNGLNLSSSNDLEHMLKELETAYLQENIFSALRIDDCLMDCRGNASPEGENLLNFLLGCTYSELGCEIQRRIDNFLKGLVKTHAVLEQLSLTDYLPQGKAYLVIKNDAFFIRG